MGAGQPNWSKLSLMGKLPIGRRGKIPFLAQLDAAEKRIKEIEKEVCDDCRERLFGVELKKEDEPGGVEVKCEVEGCGYVGVGRTEGIARNILRMHGKTHEKKE